MFVIDRVLRVLFDELVEFLDGCYDDFVFVSVSFFVPVFELPLALVQVSDPLNELRVMDWELNFPVMASGAVKLIERTLIGLAVQFLTRKRTAAAMWCIWMVGWDSVFRQYPYNGSLAPEMWLFELPVWVWACGCSTVSFSELIVEPAL